MLRRQIAFFSASLRKGYFGARSYGEIVFCRRESGAGGAAAAENAPQLYRNKEDALQI